MSLTHTFRLYDMEESLVENGTLDVKCKLKFTNGTNIICTMVMDICHDFNTLRSKLDLSSLHFLHTNYLVSLLKMRCIDSDCSPNVTTFRLNANVLDKQRRTYSDNFVEIFIFQICLRRVKSTATHQYTYRFEIRFIRLPSFLLDLKFTSNHDGNKFILSLQDKYALNNRQVTKFVFRSILIQTYMINIPYDIIALLFDGFMFGDEDEHDVSMYYKQMSKDEVLSRFSSVANKERLLTDDAFAQVFNLNRTQFYALKPWIRKKLKRDKGFC
eukprot:CAMPEP_0202710264 /NCGR_PEP_ID=MMETSP1385-20130828/22270_1 /ASSEMBLY_ACC=CAM_ASM_000861 /TAXON_ID=933848 /ORGANISM="Elphidium margaritaceum" /LENGTH=270 /DNA_ID=CAMNT_0049369759 /DNA_START=29 /DNA_END=841 /DNA_ORIENTATION=-